MKYRADESKTIMEKLDYAMEIMSNAAKSEDKLNQKRDKVFENVNKWEHPELLGAFSEEQIKRVINKDRSIADKLILPKVVQEI